MIAERMFPSWRLKQLQSDTRPNRLQHRYEVLKEKKRPNLGTSQYLSFEGGRGERGFEGGSQSFQEEQKEDQTSPTEYKVQDNCR